jgi:hypothetical protein
MSKGYVAYELRHGITEGVVEHKLRVVRVGPDRGIYIAGEAALLDFEVYHLTCSPDHIEISGWRKVLTKYVIEFSPSGKLKTVGPTEYPDVPWSDAAKDGPEPQSLGLFIPNPDPLLIESLDPEHGYQLLRNSSQEKSKEGWNERHTKSELVRLDRKGNVCQRLVLYERRDIEPRD